MDDLDENTTVFSTLRSFNNFLSQRSEESPTSLVGGSSFGFLQLQYEQSTRREADRNQDLLNRIKQLQDRETEVKTKLAEEIELNKTFKQSMEAQSKKLAEKEKKLSEANKMFIELRDKMSALEWKSMSQVMQTKTSETEKQELKEQLNMLHSKYQETTQKLQALQECQTLNAEQEQTIKELELKLAAQEQDAAIVRNMKSELARFPNMEKELLQLREENAYHREMKENNALLKEEVESLRRVKDRYDKMKEEMVSLELDKEKLSGKLSNWENLEQLTGLNIRTPDDLSRYVVALQQRELDLKENATNTTNSARLLEKARHQLQEELLTVRNQLLEEKKKREQQEALVRRLQKRVLLLTKERDGMRAILDSYDSELTPAEHSPQLYQRLREAEEMLQKVHTQNKEMEAQVSQALDEKGTMKLRADSLEAELNILKSQAGTSSQSSLIAKEELHSLRLKVEELEAERGRLEEVNANLEMTLEKMNAQGNYDTSQYKVLHLSMNPASSAQQRRLMEYKLLQEECEKLRQLVKALEGGHPLPEKLEGLGSMASSQELTDLKKQVESAELKNQRLREVFQMKIHEFRTACYMLTGYQIDITMENQYRLTSMYAEHMEDNLLFKSSTTGGKMQLLETAFSLTVREFIDLHLHHQNSIPAFLSAVTLDLFSRQTIA
ncbi:mitotic spindle assembly checkpoint protein MAD1 isoform X2 [Ambystoma mexicanum]|uniref:mitotic spindle assembly checkpoint protein MAD1 isoform X2 n=1 Tax=Ambystoma mexicanum TaxID=8296 RepID=UPI0037E78E5D